MKNTLSIRCILFLALLVPATSGLHGQTEDPAPKPLRGFVPTASYAVSDIESVNIGNGNVVVRLPIVSLPPGRAGLTGGLSLVYNSKIWQSTASYDQYPSGQGQSGFVCSPLYTLNTEDSGWKYGLGYNVRVTHRNDYFSGSCAPVCPDPSAIAKWKYDLEFPDGSVHTLTPQAYTGMQPGGPYYNISPLGAVPNCSGGSTVYSPDAPLIFYTTDGTFARLEVVPGVELTTWKLYFADGRRVEATPGHQEIFDRNGNKVVIGWTFDAGSYTQSLVDDEGRSISITYGTPRTQDTITAKGYGTQTLTWHVNWVTVASTRQYTMTDPHSEYGGFDVGGPASLPYLYVVSSVEVPAQVGASLGSLSYTFGYGENATGDTNGTGELLALTLPSGAQTAYSFWAAGRSGTLRYKDLLELQTVTQKTLTYTGQTSPETWAYDITTESSTITAPDGGATAEARTSGLAYSITQPDGSVIERVWKENRPDTSTQPVIPVMSSQVAYVNPFVSAEYRSLRTSSGTLTKTAVKLFQQDKNGNQLASNDYGFATYGSIDRSSGQPIGIGNAAWIRDTTNAFYAGSPGLYTAQQGVAATLTSLKSRMVTGTGPGSYSEYCYDNATGTANLTLEAHWDSTKGALSTPLVSCSTGRSSLSSVAIARDYTYDGYGNRLTERDANSVTTHSYYETPVCNTASVYPNRIVIAEGTSVEQTITRTYDCNTGVVKTETDPNQVTTVTDYDYFGRPKEITKADSHTSIVYSDSDRYVVTRKDLDSDGSVTRKVSSIQRFDPLYRLRLSQALESDSGTTINTADEAQGIKTERRYSLGSGGNFEVVSNPYRTTADDTMGWHRTARDKVGRVTEVKHYSGASLPAPWGSNTATTGAVTSGYSAETTTVSDEAGKTRKNTVDGAGRLVEVVEAPGVTDYGYITTYTYDALDNLQGVTQGSQTRSFSHSSLSRLLSATNPESGTIAYTYDANGSVLTKTDARSVKTCYGNWTGTQCDTSNAQGPDALNRPVLKTYSDSNPNTPAVRYCYDGQVATDGGTCTIPTPTIANSKGRLTAVSSSVATTQYTSFDALGRIKASSQKVGSQSFGFSYNYNLAGALISQGYPSGLEVAPLYDGAGRVSSLGSYANSFTYAPHGAVSQMKFVNNRWENMKFNTRLQPTEIWLGTEAENHNLLKLTLDYGTTTNNGNVLTQNILVPGFLNPIQRYHYDQVNRLIAAAEGGSVYPPVCPDAATTWCEGYGYDQYGNRWVKDTGGIFQRAVTPVAQTALNAANNRIVGNSYDSAGNQTGAGGGTFTFDAESRMTKVTLNAPQSGTFDYVYDGDGRRVKKTVYGMNSVYVYNAQGKLAAEYRDGALFKEFIYADGRMIAMVDPSQGTNYITVDHLGSTRVVTDASGNVHSRHDYLPFGKEVPIDAGRAAVAGYGAQERVLQRFTGKEVDPETGLDYFGARYYSGAQGRFTTPDWSATPAPVPYADFADPQTLNLYGYVRNNPLSRTDPDGHCCAAVEDLGRQIAIAPHPLLKAGGYLIIGAGAIGTALTNPEVRAAAADFLTYALQNGGKTAAQQDMDDLSGRTAREMTGQTPTRGEALGDAKRDAGVPTSQQPEKQANVPVTDANGKQVVVNGRPQTSREYTHTTGSGEKVTIQDHSRGHSFPDGSKVGPHFNVRPQGNTRHGSVPGTQPHYPYKKPD